MEKMAGYSLVTSGNGSRASSGLIRRKIAAADEGNDDDCGFLELSLGSIYNNKQPSADHAFVSPVSGFSPLLPTPDAITAAATKSFAPPPPAFALALGRSAAPAAATAADDGHVGGGGHVVLTANAPPVHVAIHHGHHQVAPALFACGGGIAAVPVPVPPVPVSTVPAKGAVALLGGAAPPPPSPANTKSSPRARGRRGNATTPSLRRRRNSVTAAGDAADADADDAARAPPPFPWATKTAGTHPTLASLFDRGIVSISGEVRCKRCDATKTISYDISSNFNDLSRFILGNIEAMHDRAPAEWMSPALADCDGCGQRSSLRPVIAAEKARINWMFLLLGQTLGLCTLDQLKHFCARTRQHRTGAKDRVLYSTYMELCNQLCPGGPFDMASERKNRVRPFAG